MTGVVLISNPQLIEIIAELMHKEFGADQHLAVRALLCRLQPILGCLRKDLAVFVETDYVDRVYRDSYYNYFASKADSISRDCIRLSFLDNSSGVFVEKESAGYDCRDAIKQNYLGFIVIRPTIAAVIGRSAISPSALTTHDFKCCLSSLSSTVNGFKVAVKAFPFSSQDGETITCAETSLWALMEYYGNKYPEYSPITPSEIIENLEGSVACRQLPSNGLTVENVTYALKTFGFGPQLYEYSSFEDESSRILSCFIESGIPIVVAISNAQAGDGKSNEDLEAINHAVLCIGRENLSPEAIDKAVSSKMEEMTSPYGKVHVLDYDDIEKRFVFIDDNCPPYQKDFLATPADRYSGQPDWNACRISNFVAPLYKRIYLEPFMAKNYVRRLLRTNYYSHLKDEKIVFRTYLCSTRSFRDFANGSSMTIEMKDMISSVFMPKFVWIAEISKIDDFMRQVVDNLIIFDATSFSTSNLDSLLIAFVNNACYAKDRKTKVLTKYDISTNPFEVYYNLK